MAHGINRFLTTHTGSLPRPDDLIRAMFAKEEGVPVDRTGLAAKIRAAVAGAAPSAAPVAVRAGSLVSMPNDGGATRRLDSKVKAIEAGGIRTSRRSYGWPICVSLT